MAEANPSGLSALAIVGQLASPARLRVVAALVLGARTPAAVVELSGLDADQATVALTRLLRAGLVTANGKGADGRGLALDEAAFGAAARAGAPTPSVEDFGSADAAVTKVLRAFVTDGRLTSIPAPGRKRLVVLEYLASGFEPGVRYPEREVDAILRAWHPDYAALRRYLVEAQLLSRDRGEYWRSGGWVDVL